MIDRINIQSKELEIFGVDMETCLELPYFSSGISAGFPSPAGDFIKSYIDLNKMLIKNPSSTFWGRVQGDSLTGIGIFDNSLILIDKSLQPKNDDIGVCWLNGEFTVKILKFEEDGCLLMPANDKYSPIKVRKNDGNDFSVWGIVPSWVCLRKNEISYI